MATLSARVGMLTELPCVLTLPWRVPPVDVNEGTAAALVIAGDPCSAASPWPVMEPVPVLVRSDSLILCRDAVLETLPERPYAPDGLAVLGVCASSDLCGEWPMLDPACPFVRLDDLRDRLLDVVRLSGAVRRIPPARGTWPWP